MPHRCVNPHGISEPQTYSHVVVAKGSTTMFIAGQVAEDDGTLVGAGDRHSPTSAARWRPSVRTLGT